MSSKNTKTILFASLIAAMILPFSAMDYASAETNKIEEFKQKALRDNDIPSSELLDRVGDKWLSKYKDTEHFEQEQDAVKRFVDRNLHKDGLNKDNAVQIIKIQNFETITGSVGDGHEIVLLVAELQKAKGKYAPSEPIRKYHEWIATQYTVPDNIKEVSDRLLEIVGDARFLKLAQKQAESFNKLAENGSVPSELMKSDSKYWNLIIHFKLCELDSECDLDQLRHQPGASEEAIQEFQRKAGNPADVAFNFWNYVLPEAHAAWHKEYVNYTLSAVINLEACWYQNCYESWWDGTNSGSQSIDVDHYYGNGGNIEHVYANYDMSFYGTACDTHGGSETVISEVDTTPYLAYSLATSLSENDVEYNNCAYTQNTSTATHNWIVGILVESPGSYYWAP